MFNPRTLGSRTITGKACSISNPCANGVFRSNDCHRDQLYHNKTKLLVDLAHIRAWNEQIADLLETKPTEALPLVGAI